MIDPPYGVRQFGNAHIKVRADQYTALVDLAWLADASQLVYEPAENAVYYDNGIDRRKILDHIGQSDFADLTKAVVDYVARQASAVSAADKTT